jgi:hypothetical protein
MLRVRKSVRAQHLRSVVVLPGPALGGSTTHRNRWVDERGSDPAQSSGRRTGWLGVSINGRLVADSHGTWDFRRPTPSPSRLKQREPELLDLMLAISGAVARTALLACRPPPCLTLDPTVASRALPTSVADPANRCSRPGVSVQRANAAAGRMVVLALARPQHMSGSTFDRKPVRPCPAE